MGQILKVKIWRWILLLSNDRVVVLSLGKPVYLKCVSHTFLKANRKVFYSKLQVNTWHFASSRVIRFSSHQRLYLKSADKLKFAKTASLTLFFVNTRTFDLLVLVRISFDKPCLKRPSFINNINYQRWVFWRHNRFTQDSPASLARSSSF